VPMPTYLADPGFGSGKLRWLDRSALHYRHVLTQPREETSATQIGEAVHSAVLEPEMFAASYIAEPDLAQFGDGPKPRATKAYKEWFAGAMSGGLHVLKPESLEAVLGMATAVKSHKRAAQLLERCPEHEVTMIWERDGRRCRGRVDMLGDSVIADLKTTRSLDRFSPFVISDELYHVQMGWYVDGLARLGRKIAHVFLIAIESSPPFDVGVFTLGHDTIRAGQMHADMLMDRLAEAERTDVWPGMFEEVVEAQLTDRLTEQYAGEEVA